MDRTRLRWRLLRNRRIGLITAAVAFAVTAALCAPALAQEAASVPLDSLLSQNGTKAPAIGQVERIALGSQGATVTLEGGEEVVLDLSGLAGVGGGPNYIGWGMVLLGLSVFARLLSSVSRIIAPFRSRARRRSEDE